MSLYLSQASKSDSLSFCLNPFIWALSISVLLGGKYRAKKTFFNSFHVVTELDGRDWSQALALSLNENGKRRSLIASELTPFAFAVSAYCKTLTNVGSCPPWDYRKIGFVVRLTTTKVLARNFGFNHRGSDAVMRFIL